MHKDLIDLLEMREDRTLSREIMDKLSENVELIIRGQVMNSFTGLRNTILTLLKELKQKSLQVPLINDEAESENLKKEIYNLLNIFKNRFYVSLCDTLVELKTFIAS